MGTPRTPKGRAAAVAVRLADEYPAAHPAELCELDHRSPFELLAATILSAQCTDARVNLITPELFARYPSPAALAVADPGDVERIVQSTGFYAAKTRSLLGMAGALVERFGGSVPSGIDDLVSLPGVGRKTANLMLAVVFDQPGLPVDTHVKRVAGRLGLTEQSDPDRVEQDLVALVRRDQRSGLALRMILHGRRVCDAKRPACGRCVLADLCPWLRQVPVKMSGGA
jgi:endonuclease III